MENKGSKNENQAKVSPKVQNAVNLIVKIVFGLGFIFFIYNAIIHRYGG
jgi:hypothetical protein